MGEMFKIVEKIKEKAKTKGLAENLTLSRIGLKTGVIIKKITTDTPDDPVKIAKLKTAAAEVLGEAI